MLGSQAAHGGLAGCGLCAGQGRPSPPLQCPPRPPQLESLPTALGSTGPEGPATRSENPFQGGALGLPPGSFPPAPCPYFRARQALAAPVDTGHASGARWLRWD